MSNSCPFSFEAMHMSAGIRMLSKWFSDAGSFFSPFFSEAGMISWAFNFTPSNVSVPTKVLFPVL